MRAGGRLLAAVAAVSLLATACGSDSGTTDDETESATETMTSEVMTTEEETATAAPTADGEPIRVGVISTTSGPLSGYGNQFVEGFEAGLAYATDGTNAVNGRPIEVEVRDDTADPAEATAIATELIGDGVKVLTGTVSSGVALQVGPLAEQNDILYISGPAATDGITGLNRNTFRSGRQTTQDVLTATQFVGDVEGTTVTVFAQDSAFGQANAGAVDAILGARGATVDSILVPADTTDFAPFAVQAKDKGADLLFVAWAGDTAAAMWQSLSQQDVFSATTVVTGLDQRASYDTSFGDVGSEINFLAHYFAEAPDNDVNAYLVDNVGQADLFTPDGFVAAQMVVQALTEGDVDDTTSMITALEGWTFDAPKGSQTIRAEDHAMLQPMFQARLTDVDGTVTPELVDTVDAEAVAPEPAPFAAR